MRVFTSNSSSVGEQTKAENEEKNTCVMCCDDVTASVVIPATGPSVKVILCESDRMLTLAQQTELWAAGPSVLSVVIRLCQRRGGEGRGGGRERGREGRRERGKEGGSSVRRDGASGGRVHLLSSSGLKGLQFEESSVDRVLLEELLCTSCPPSSPPTHWAG